MQRFIASLIVCLALAHAAPAQDESTPDLKAQYQALVASVAVPGEWPRATHTGFLNLAAEFRAELDRRVKVLEDEMPPGAWAHIELSLAWMTDEELERGGHDEDVVEAARALVAWYDTSTVAERLDRLIRTGPPLMPAHEWDGLDPRALSEDHGLHGALRQLAMAEASRARFLANQGDLDGFVESTERTLEMQRMLATAPGALSDLIRSSIGTLALSAISHRLTHHGIDDDLATRLLAVLRRAEEEHIEASLHHLEGERLIATQSALNMIELADPLRDPAVPNTQELNEAFEEHFDKVSAFLVSEDHLSDLPESRLPDLFTDIVVTDPLMRSTCFMLTRMRAVILALEIERYRAATGELPAFLDTLVDSGRLASLPVNRFSDDPAFGYTLDDRSPTGYTLYLTLPEDRGLYWMVPANGIENFD